MSVFTTVNQTQLTAWLHHYSIGELLELKGISAGITNTNYFVSTSQGRYVLTLFEHNDIKELPFFIDLMSHLAARGVPCPAPIYDKTGQALHLLNQKPAALVSCLKGRDVESPNVAQCAAVGRTLAQMHLAGLDFNLKNYAGYRNARDATWRTETAAHIMPHLSPDEQALLQQALNVHHTLAAHTLPQGIIHADLFKDNVLFDGDHIGGLIDFYYACHEVLAYDLAIAVNDWCVTPDGTLAPETFNALWQSYQAVRPLNPAEIAAWPHLLVVAALRFWLSRLYDRLFPQAGELTHTKDPDHFKRILSLRLAQLSA